MSGQPLLDLPFLVLGAGFSPSGSYSRLLRAREGAAHSRSNALQLAVERDSTLHFLTLFRNGKGLRVGLVRRFSPSGSYSRLLYP